jgi:aminoglycoside phosphotransferase (APT) family kinase protein
LESTTKVHLSEHTIRHLCQSAFGSAVTLIHVDELTEGWYNTAYAVNLSNGYKTVLKIGPPEDADILSYEHDIMRTEVEVMRLVESNPHIPVPHISAADFSRTLIPNSYYFMDYIQGAVWNDIAKQLNPAQQNQLFYQAGEIVAHINSYHHDRFGYVALEPKYTTWLDAVHHFFVMLFTDSVKYKIDLPVTLDEVKIWLETHAGCFHEVTIPQLVHWDLWQGNIFVDMQNGEPRICGVIDFERVYWGDPLGEAFFRGKGHPAFLEGYGRPMLQTRSQRVRNLFYDLYLYIIMVVEDGPRKYSDRGVVQRARRQLEETLEQLRDSSE